VLIPIKVEAAHKKKQESKNRKSTKLKRNEAQDEMKLAKIQILYTLIRKRKNSNDFI